MKPTPSNRSYLVISPGLAHPDIDRIDVDVESKKATVRMKDSKTHVLDIAEGEHPGQYVADGNQHPHLIGPQPPGPPPPPPAVDNVKVWKSALSAGTFEEMKSNIAKEVTRQVEEQHFNASLDGTERPDHEALLKELSKWLPS